MLLLKIMSICRRRYQAQLQCVAPILKVQGYFHSDICKNQTDCPNSIIWQLLQVTQARKKMGERGRLGEKAEKKGGRKKKKNEQDPRPSPTPFLLILRRVTMITGCNRLPAKFQICKPT